MYHVLVSHLIRFCVLDLDYNLLSVSWRLELENERYEVIFAKGIYKVIDYQGMCTRFETEQFMF